MFQWPHVPVSSFMFPFPILSCSCGRTLYQIIVSIPDIADQRNLMPMYQKLHSSIRKFDNDHILFFEPTIIITSVSQLVSFPGHSHYHKGHVTITHVHTIFSQLPVKFSATGLTEGPGGPEYNDRCLAYYVTSFCHSHLLPLIACYHCNCLNVVQLVQCYTTH